jgi:DNA-binding MarR family transcriptional regulator
VGQQTLKELKQTRPFESLEVEAYVGLLRTADALLRGIEAVLKNAGLSPTQYNVLRILRGAGRTGLSCREIAERMITRDPDITRLLDRLEKRRLIARARGALDRRLILTRISARGLSLLKTLDQPVVAVHRKQLRHLGEKRLRRLVRLLEEARAASQ